MTVVGLNFMLRTGHVLDELLDTIHPLARIAVPCQGRRSTVELGQVIRASGGVVRGIVQTSELVCSPRRDIYAGPSVNDDSDRSTWTYSSRVNGVDIFEEAITCDLDLKP